MAKFDESKVINALHKDKAEVGKIYWFADFIDSLEGKVERGDACFAYKLTDIDKRGGCCFHVDGSPYALIYPYEEPPKQRMTRGQLMEWLSKGFGLFRYDNGRCFVALVGVLEEDLNEECAKDILIRPWDSDEWIDPTVDIYLRDCKHLSQDEIDDTACRDGC